MIKSTFLIGHQLWYQIYHIKGHHNKIPHRAVTDTHHLQHGHTTLSALSSPTPPATNPRFSTDMTIRLFCSLQSFAFLFKANCRSPVTLRRWWVLIVFPTCCPRGDKQRNWIKIWIFVLEGLFHQNRFDLLAQYVVTDKWVIRTMPE